MLLRTLLGTKGTLIEVEMFPFDGAALQMIRGFDQYDAMMPDFWIDLIL
jgi:hypothetical protein